MVPVKSPWWKEYRQQHHQETLSVEMVVRRSFLEALREYGESCSISGVRQMCDPKISWLQRLFRISLFCILMALLWYVILYICFNTLANPLIVSTESSTYPIGEIDFPAVALCNINRISRKAMQGITKTIFASKEFMNLSLEDLENFALQSGRLLDFSFDPKEPYNAVLGNVAFDVKYDSQLIVEYMKQLAPPCKEMLLRCSFGGKIVPCETLFKIRRTARGHCCAFNYILGFDSTLSQEVLLGEAQRQYMPGHLHGLNVILDPMLDDYAYPISVMRGFDVLLFAPPHFPDLSAGRLGHRLAQPGHGEFIKLHSIKQLAAKEVRKYPLNIRKCLFKDELPEQFNGMYSYSACIVRCRIKAIRTLCKCTPYFLPAGNGEGPICTMNDLKCLNKYKEKLLYLYPEGAEKTEGLEIEIEDSLFCPHCLPDCELTTYYFSSYKFPLKRLEHRSYHVDNFIKGLNTSNKVFLSISHPVADGFLDRLDVVSYWYEILSSVGGYGGVILGLSVLNVVEIVYFFIFRFVVILRHNYIKYH